MGKQKIIIPSAPQSSFVRNYGTGYPTLHNNLSIKRPWKAGKNCNFYKGGRRVDRKGYIDILDRTHPFADTTGYIPEHRLVVERHLNAILLPWVDVHHLNGDKQDNRIENLQPVFHRQHGIDHNPKDPIKSYLGRSRRKKKWWNKLAQDKERLAKANAIRRLNYWKNRDREIKRLRGYRQKKKIG